MKKFILALDQGTTSSRAIVFDHDGLPVSSAQKEFTQYFPKPGWQDRRTADFCDKRKRDGHASKIQKKTGLIIDAYFSATKVKWILDNVKGARELPKKGELGFGTVDSWLVWNLTGGKLQW